MNKHKLIILLLVLYNFSLAQNKEARIYLNKDGSIYDHKDNSNFNEKINSSFSYRKTADSGYVYTSNVDRQVTLIANYKIVKEYIESVTNRKYADSTAFLIDYNYYDDACGRYSGNYISRSIIKERKETTYSFNKESIDKYKNVKILFFFEPKIEVKNNPKSKDESFFSDSKNFFRTHFFKTPTLCGAKMLLKPDGKCFIINGETSITSLLKYNSDEAWKKLFESY